MAAIRLSAALIAIFNCAFAQGNSSGAQLLQPARANFVSRQNSLPQSGNLIFQHNIYDGVGSAQTGSFTYARTGSVTYPTSTGILTEVAANALPIGAKAFDASEEVKGVRISGATKNWLLRSEEFENAAWAAVGGGSAAAGTADSPLSGVDTIADTISGASGGDGIYQDSNRTTSAGRTWVFSVYLATSSGSTTVKIVIKDEGTEAGFTECVATTTWQRCQVPHRFAAPTGTTNVQILVGNTSNVRVFGAQLEDWQDASFDRERFAGANDYIRTTTAAASAGAAAYQIPNSISAQIANKGTVCSWVWVEYDHSELYGNEPRILSIDEDKFSIYLANKGPEVRINSATVLTGPVDKNETFPTDEWFHFCFTHDATADQIKMYMNGQLAYQASPAIADIVVGAHAMNIGNYEPVWDNLGLDGQISQFAVWKTVLTAEEVAAVYNSRKASYLRSDPGSGLLFAVDLGTSLVPTTGDTHYHYNFIGNGRPFVPTTTVNWTQTSQTLPAFGMALGGASKTGLAVWGDTTNLILRSEAIAAAAWTDINTPTTTDSVGTFFSTITYGTIDGTAGEGRQQSSATDAYDGTNGRKATASLWAQVGSGTLAFDIVIDSDAGTAAAVTCGKTATTTITRFDCHNNTFTSASTGKLRMKIVLQGTGVLRVGGMMLNEVDSDLTNENATTPHFTVAPYYISTAAATQRVKHNTLKYRAKDSINYNKGTAIVWGAMYVVPDETLVNAGPTLLGGSGQNRDWYFRVSTQAGAPQWALTLDYNGDITRTFGLNPTRNTWYHYSVTWDNTLGTPEVKTYLDGSIDTNDTIAALSSDLRSRHLWVGNDGTPSMIFMNQDHWPGVIDSIKIYGDVKDAAFLLSDFNSTKATYGR